MTGNAAATSDDQLTSRWQHALMDNFGTPRLPLVRGEGVHVWDAEGKRYTDYLGGIAVNSLGHAHPAIVAAVTRQIGTLGHVSNLFMAEQPIRLAERLIGHTGHEEARVYFSNSGAEANEAAFKLARLTGRTHMVSALGAFHGRTMGALALTAQPKKQDGFHPLPGDVTNVPYGDVEALRAAVTEETAAVILEPIQGENGVVVPPADYLVAAREITRAKGALLILDEIQTGIGRCGHWFRYQAFEGVDPDVVTLAKGLGGGLPIGATIAFGDAAHLFKPGHHGSTFSGNPVVCAAANAVLDTIEQDGLLDHVTKVGERLRAGVTALNDPLVDHVRGAGLLIGIVLTRPVAGELQAALQRAGFLVNAAAPDVIRLAPPLILTEWDVDAFLAVLPGVLRSIK
ncbi:acetylornithine transaminase [Streptacidiphilus anmyonensis]|uniref:acetylornithine transaminase n=1 Tax=Streptacidiphilus anmyonensis TaxID=405782 RepID=UPI0005A874C2|nr:acetylornithine transaminase [Streptacidiphilus anmyonensis]